jgi:hypothetical protein
MKLACPRLPSVGSTEATMMCTLAMPPLVAQVLTAVQHPLVGYGLVVDGPGADRGPTSLPASGSDGAEGGRASRRRVPNICGSPLPDLLARAVADQRDGRQRAAPTRDSAMPASPQNSSSNATDDAEPARLERLLGEEVERVEADLGRLFDEWATERLLTLVPFGSRRAGSRSPRTSCTQSRMSRRSSLSSRENSHRGIGHATGQ